MNQMIARRDFVRLSSAFVTATALASTGCGSQQKSSNDDFFDKIWGSWKGDLILRAWITINANGYVEMQNISPHPKGFSGGGYDPLTARFDYDTSNRWFDVECTMTNGPYAGQTLFRMEYQARNDRVVLWTIDGHSPQVFDKRITSWKTCEHCGAENPSDFSHCYMCGNTVKRYIISI